MTVFFLGALLTRPQWRDSFELLAIAMFGLGVLFDEAPVVLLLASVIVSSALLFKSQKHSAAKLIALGLSDIGLAVAVTLQQLSTTLWDLPAAGAWTFAATIPLFGASLLKASTGVNLAVWQSAALAWFAGIPVSRAVLVVVCLAAAALVSGERSMAPFVLMAAPLTALTSAELEFDILSLLVTSSFPIVLLATLSQTKTAAPDAGSRAKLIGLTGALGSVLLIKSASALIWLLVASCVAIVFAMRIPASKGMLVPAIPHLRADQAAPPRLRSLSWLLLVIAGAIAIRLAIYGASTGFL